jgi:hypothetical protein
MKRHDLKCWPSHFELIEQGRKAFEVRANDRDFQAGDYVRLHLWDPLTRLYLGRYIGLRIRTLQQGTFGLPPTVCVFDWQNLEVVANEYAGDTWERENRYSEAALRRASNL